MRIHRKRQANQPTDQNLHQANTLHQQKRASHQVKSKVSAEVMELSIAEDELKNQALIDSNTPANERPEHEVRVLKARFSVLCDRFFAESMADGWWISTDSQRQTTIQLSNQAVDMLRRDRTAATAPQRG
jgi:hypothetical protein